MIPCVEALREACPEADQGETKVLGESVLAAIGGVRSVTLL